MATATTAIEPTVKVSATKLLINGKWVNSASGKTFPTINPATGDVITQVQEADAADVDRAVIAARAAFETGAWRRKMTASQRGVMLNRLADLIEKNADELAQLESLDNGKPFNELAHADLPLVDRMLPLLRRMGGQDSPARPSPSTGNYFSYTRHEPVGVVGQIIPWNFPLLMQAWKLGAGTGCGKHGGAETGRADAADRLARRRTGPWKPASPSGVDQRVAGLRPDSRRRAVAHMDVDKIAFTGESPNGQDDHAAAAETNLKRVTLELGGKSPNIVFADADMDAGRGRARTSALFFNQGQCCCAGSRLFVEEKVYDEFVEKSVAKAKEPQGRRSVRYGHRARPAGATRSSSTR